MCTPVISDDFQPRGDGSRVRAACEIALVFLVFFIQGAWPAPDVNEPHYLSKARHYWDADWCPDDFFCNSADAHQVFYWTFGWLTRWLPMAATAWCGRILTWGLLAWAWRRLSWLLVPGPYYAVLSAALLVAMVDRCQMAGEWIIGGVEAKGFAYVLVLLGIEALVRGRWGYSFLLFGAASSFHVIVGGWSVVAAGVAWLASAQRPPLRQLILPLAGGLVLALPGLLPAIALTWRVDPQVVSEANRIYVYERLYHHLLPERFPPWFIVRHLLLVAALVALVRLAGPTDPRFARLRGFVAAAVGIAASGIAISLLVPVAPDLSASLLRFYWFRLSDVMVPLGAALVGCSLLLGWQRAGARGYGAALAAALLVAGAYLGDTIWQRGMRPWPPADAAIGNLAAWQEMCEWVASETPTDAVFLTPRLAQTFRWYAGRAEVVSRKDIPQDATGIVEWWRRMETIHRAEDGASEAPWRQSLAELGAGELARLGREFGADYVITVAEPPVALERVGPRNPSYAIYRLPSGQAGAFDPPRHGGR